MNAQLKKSMASSIEEQAKPASRIIAHGVSTPLTAMATHDWREKFAVSRAWSYGALENRKAAVSKDEENMARDIFMLIQSYCLEVLPADFDQLSRAQRVNLVSKDELNLWAKLEGELESLQAAMLKASPDNLSVDNFTDKKSTWQTYLRKIKPCIEKGYNPAMLNTNTGSLMFDYLIKYTSFVKKATEDEAKAAKEKADAEKAKAAAMTAQGKLLAYKASVTHWFANIIDQCDSIADIDNIMLNQHLRDSIAKQLRNVRHDVDDSAIASLKAQFDSMRDSVLNPPDAVESQPIPGDNSDEKAAYNQGYDCCLNDGTLDDCPYDEGTMRKQWRDGFKAARDTLEEE